MPVAIIGRDRELAALGDFLDAAAEGPAVLLLEGEAGIGKTVLWEAGVRLAQARGTVTLDARPIATETQLAFSGVGDLFRPPAADVLSSLPVPQRRALAAALLLEEPEGAPPDARAVATAVVSAVRILARDALVVIAVDDVHWLDPSSAHALSFAVRRLIDQPVGFLLARRTGVVGDAVLSLDRPPVRETVHRVPVGPLSLAALQRVIRMRLDIGFPRPILRRLHDASRGNPFFALELAQALRDADGGTPTGNLPVPDSVRPLVRERLAALPPATRETLRFAALLPNGDVDRLAAVLGPDVRGALVAAEQADVVEVRGDRIRFTHPLFASGLTETMGAAERRTAHGRLATAASDVEERARHLALASAEPDAEVASQIDGAARAVAARGALAAAAELAEHARRLTPEDRVEDACRRAIEAGWLCFVAGDSAQAAALLEDAAARAGRRPLGALASARLARVLHNAVDRRRAEPVYEAAIAAAGDDTAIAAEAHEGLAWCVLVQRENLPLAGRHARRAVELYEKLDDRSGLADALSAQAQTEFLMGGGLPSTTMSRALAVGAHAADLRASRRPAMHEALLLMCADRLDEARSRYLEVRDWAVTHGDESTVPWLLMRLAQLELLAGRWAQASAYADEGHELATHSGQPLLEADLLGVQALVAAHRGHVDRTREIGREAAARADRLGAGVGARLAAWALGLLELSVGDATAALVELDPLRRASDVAGLVDPGENRHLGDLIEALVRLDRVDEADAVANELERRGRRLARPGALAVAGRGHGLIALARGDIAIAVETLEAALEAHAGALIPFESERTRLALGSARLRARHRRAARLALETAAAGFDRLGAARWADRARGELARLGGRAASNGDLTPTEQRVAALVAQGRTNREVASVLFVADRTVEYHLTHIYGKLGVRSRSELAARFRPAR